MSSIHGLLRQAKRQNIFTTLRSSNLRLSASCTRAQWLPQAQRRLQRFASTEAPKTRANKPAPVNVYRAGTAATLGVGLTRLSTIVLFLAGTLAYAPAFFFSPDHSNWLVPVFIVGSAVPAVVVTLATGPMVHAIRVHLPESVRRGGKEALKKFSTDTPLETRVDLVYMRWKPWPQTKNVGFYQLRRLRPSFSSGISNLEYLQELHGDSAAAQKQYPTMDKFVKRGLTRFYVKRDQKMDRAAVPGVWDGMWKQIPWIEEGGKGAKEFKRSSATTPGKWRPVVPPMAAVGRP